VISKFRVFVINTQIKKMQRIYNQGSKNHEPRTMNPEPLQYHKYKNFIRIIYTLHFGKTFSAERID
jgi:hypothetical protein